jgi:hypothetical protein
MLVDPGSNTVIGRSLFELTAEEVIELAPKLDQVVS